MYSDKIFKKIYLLLLLLLISLKLFAISFSPKEFESNLYFNFIKAMEESYPENFVGYGFDTDEQLWFLDLKHEKIEEEKRFYYKNGRFLSKEKIFQWKEYNPISLEYYPKEIPNPENFSKIKVERLKKMSNEENRDSSKPNCFTLIQDFLYQAYTPKQIEPQIVTIEFLDWKVRVHYKIKDSLLNVDKKIRDLAKTDKEVNQFLNLPTIITGYNWREVRDNSNRSSHSWGISIDIVPKKYGSKQIYWKWTQDFYGDNWITFPIKKRWMPPKKVISIFESEGFIWGGKWDIWDNMHFEYHPEIIQLSNPS